MGKGYFVVYFRFCSSGLKDVVIIVRSQHNSYHMKKAESLKKDLVEQAKAMEQKVMYLVRF